MSVDLVANEQQNFVLFSPLYSILAIATCLDHSHLQLTNHIAELWVAIIHRR